MKADTDVLYAEARSQLKSALLSYRGDPRHVAIYAASRTRITWNELQTRLARADHASDPQRVRTMKEAVEGHLEDELRRYLQMGSTT